MIGVEEFAYLVQLLIDEKVLPRSLQILNDGFVGFGWKLILVYFDILIFLSQFLEEIFPTFLCFLDGGGELMVKLVPFLH